MKKLKLIFSIFVVLAVFTVACDKKADINKEENKEKTTANEKGQELFNVNCASCHGEKGLADTPTAKALKPAPRNFVTEEIKSGKTIEGITKVINDGFNGGKTGMVSFKAALGSDENVKAVAQYVLELASTK